MLLQLSLSIAHAESFHIGKIQYEIKGRTTVKAVKRLLQIDTSREFSTRKELSTYVNNLKKVLSNCRMFDYTNIVETFSQLDSSNIIEDSLIIKIHDTNNIITVPFPSFDSNTGFSLKLKYKDYNSAGSLLHFSASLYYAPDDDTFDAVPDNLLGGNIEVVTPFSINYKNGIFLYKGNLYYVLNRNIGLFNTAVQYEWYPVSKENLHWGPYIFAQGESTDAYTKEGFEATAGIGQKIAINTVKRNDNF